MTRDELISRLNLDDEDEDMILLDGLDDACLGVVEQGSLKVAVYSAAQCVQILMRRDGMSHDDAWDFFYSNIQSAGFGPKTPMFFTALLEADLDPQN